MSRALQIAKRGLYSTDPNPRVGCVIVKNDTILAEGWHKRAGQAHAEVDALNKLSVDAVGATCYISLEPCVHHGRVSPCIDALIGAGIKHVIMATTDPNPLVNGKGLRALNEANIKTSIGLMQTQARELNAGFEMRMTMGRPFVRCKLAMSLDAKTALADGNSQWISSVESRSDVQRLRARSSAILTTAATVIKDDPSMNVRTTAALAWPNYDRQPLRTILDTNLAIPTSAKILHLLGDVIIFHASNDQDKQTALENIGVRLVMIDAQEKQQFLTTVLQHLAEKNEINEILVEAGATLAGSLLQARLIDELIIYLAPTVLGSDAKGLFTLPLLTEMSNRHLLKFTDIRSIGTDIRITATIQ